MAGALEDRGRTEGPVVGQHPQDRVAGRRPRQERDAAAGAARDGHGLLGAGPDGGGQFEDARRVRVFGARSKNIRRRWTAGSIGQRLADHLRQLALNPIDHPDAARRIGSQPPGLEERAVVGLRQGDAIPAVAPIGDTVSSTASTFAPIADR
jgi:hypothetical protein